jgi:hypothetical protein
MNCIKMRATEESRPLQDIGAVEEDLRLCLAIGRPLCRAIENVDKRLPVVDADLLRDTMTAGCSSESPGLMRTQTTSHCENFIAQDSGATSGPASWSSEISREVTLSEPAG